jgi:hypothetical protein
MNKRIRELAEQAWAWAEQQEYTDPTKEFSYILEDKFAELIVGECCSLLQTENIQHDSYGYNQNFLHKKIKDHFGV